MEQKPIYDIQILISLHVHFYYHANKHTVTHSQQAVLGITFGTVACTIL